MSLAKQPSLCSHALCKYGFGCSHGGAKAADTPAVRPVPPTSFSSLTASFSDFDEDSRNCEEGLRSALHQASHLDQAYSGKEDARFTVLISKLAIFAVNELKERGMSRDELIKNVAAKQIGDQTYLEREREKALKLFNSRHDRDVVGSAAEEDADDDNDDEPSESDDKTGSEDEIAPVVVPAAAIDDPKDADWKPPVTRSSKKRKAVEMEGATRHKRARRGPALLDR